MARSPELVFTVAGATYRAKMGEFTPRDALDFRQAFGVPLVHAVAGGQIDIDIIAGLVWLIRRRANPRLQLGEVLDSFTYDDAEMGAGSGTPAEEPTDPPA